MSDTHKVEIVRIGEILPHPNADKLELTMVGGYQCVIGKGQYKTDDLAVYIQPDSVVPQAEPFQFLWIADYPTGDVPARRRRITVKRLRKEYSEGLLMPIRDLGFYLGENGQLFGFNGKTYNEGDDVADVLGITRYVPEFDAESTKADTEAMPKRKYPKTLKGWWYFFLQFLGFPTAKQKYAMEVSFVLPDYDVNALKNARRDNTFREGEQVIITEKIHGSNARYTFISDEDRPNPLNPNGKFYVGSHHQWKRDGGNVWWNVTRQFPFIEEFCTQNPGKVLYGEVGPTQKGYRYGAGDKEAFFFAFDVYDPKTNTWEWPGNVGVPHTAPVLYVGPYTAGLEKQYVDGPSVVTPAGVDKRTQREGIVISSKERRLKLKVVSNAFYEGDSK